jgi:hypothetical protein
LTISLPLAYSRIKMIFYKNQQHYLLIFINKFLDETWNKS